MSRVVLVTLIESLLVVPDPIRVDGIGSTSGDSSGGFDTVGHSSAT